MSKYHDLCCTNCNGTGRIPDPWKHYGSKDCWACKGTGIKDTKLVAPQSELGKPQKKWSDTFSAMTVLKQEFFERH